MVRPPRRAFLEPGPDVRRPLGNGDCVAFPAAARRGLRAPCAAPEQAPKAGGTISEAKVALNEGHHPLEGPEFIAPAMGARPLASPCQQLLALRCTQCGLTARMPFGAETSVPLLGHGITPATDRARGRVHLAGYLADAPANLQQGHRHTTTNFQLLLRAFGSQVPLIGTTDSFL